MEKVIVRGLNEVYIHVDSEDLGVLQELKDFFTFFVPGYRFMPKYQNKMWDGKIRLYNKDQRLLYKGLYNHVKAFCEEREYEFVDEDGDLDINNGIDHEELEELFSGLKNAPKWNQKQFEIQLKGIEHAIKKNRAVILGPTGIGKSIIIYCIIEFLLQLNPDVSKVLIVVPTVSLAYQFDKEISLYSSLANGTPYYNRIIAESQGKNCDSEKIVISTWQSIYEQPVEWFEQFDAVFGDECHQFKANSLKTIMTKLQNCRYRFGFTGTLDGTQTHKLVLEGLFGPVMKFVSTKELIDKNILSDFKINALLLKYPTKDCRTKRKYQDEIKFLISNEQRNNYIRNLACAVDGTTLVLFQMVKKHGQILYDLIKAKSDKKVFFIHGGVPAAEREAIRELAENEDIIIVASYGTFSTGINIKKLHNIVFASPSKSRIRNLQSIGRGLRKSDNKNLATLYDIADDLSHKSFQNLTLKHFTTRIKLYNEEDFNYKIHKITFKDK